MSIKILKGIYSSKNTILTQTVCFKFLALWPLSRNKYVDFGCELHLHSLSQPVCGFHGDLKGLVGLVSRDVTHNINQYNYLFFDKGQVVENLKPSENYIFDYLLKILKMYILVLKHIFSQLFSTSTSSDFNQGNYRIYKYKKGIWSTNIRQSDGAFYASRARD